MQKTKYYELSTNMLRRLLLKMYSESKQNMASIYIDSNDHDTTLTFNLNSTVQGTYKLVDQTFSTDPIPWVYFDTDAFVLEVNALGGEPETITFNWFDDPSVYAYSDDLATVGNVLETAWNTVGASLEVINQFTCTVTLVNNDTQFQIDLTKPVTIRFSDVMCTASQLFNKSTDLTSTDIGGTYRIQLSTYYLTTTPNHLFMVIDECPSRFITSSNSTTIRPTLIMTTQESAYIGQSIYIRDAVNALNISVYRTNIGTVPVTLNNTWTISLSKA